MKTKYLFHQLRQLFGSTVPAFPPKFYLTMAKQMAGERRQSQLEQYLQNITLDSNITNSDVFIDSFKLQQDTFKIQTQRAFLDVHLADGSNIRLYIQISGTAERILVTLCEVGLSREFIKYFSLFFFQDWEDKVSVVKKVAELELPYVSLQSMKELHCKLGIRKWVLQRIVKTTHWSSNLSTMTQAHETG
ncbi:LOW QUALITY PROTEIN: sorting nexin-31 [Cyanocitta cristata]